MVYSGAPLGDFNLSRRHSETCNQALLLIQAHPAIKVSESVSLF